MASDVVAPRYDGPFLRGARGLCATKHINVEQNTHKKPTKNCKGTNVLRLRGGSDRDDIDIELDLNLVTSTRQILMSIDSKGEELAQVSTDMERIGKVGLKWTQAVKFISEEISAQFKMQAMDNATLVGRITEVRELFQEEKRKSRVLSEKFWKVIRR